MSGAKLTRYLHIVEEESGKLGLKLNKGKCQLLTTNNRMQVRFKDGTKMKVAEAAEYLGALLTKTADINAELATRTKKAMQTWRRLGNYWKKSANSRPTVQRAGSLAMALKS